MSKGRSPETLAKVKKLLNIVGIIGKPQFDVVKALYNNGKDFGNNKELQNAERRFDRDVYKLVEPVCNKVSISSIKSTKTGNRKIKKTIEKSKQNSSEIRNLQKKLSRLNEKIGELNAQIAFSKNSRKYINKLKKLKFKYCGLLNKYDDLIGYNSQKDVSKPKIEWDARKGQMIVNGIDILKCYESIEIEGRRNLLIIDNGKIVKLFFPSQITFLRNCSKISNVSDKNLLQKAIKWLKTSKNILITNEEFQNHLIQFLLVNTQKLNFNDKGKINFEDIFGERFLLNLFFGLRISSYLFEYQILIRKNNSLRNMLIPETAAPF